MAQMMLLIANILCAVFLVACQSNGPIQNSLATQNQSAVKPKVEFFIRGVDVSKYQGDVDFSRLKNAGVHYVFIRATEGITYQDPDYQSNHAEAKAAGLKVGVYHFYETNDDPMHQLKNFTEQVSLSAGDLAPVIDIEKLHQNDDKNLTDSLRLFLNGLEAHYGIKPIIYTGKNFANRYLTDFGDYPLWLAEYQVQQPQVPVGWSHWTFWQWSQSGTVSGVDGSLDMDRFNGDEEKLSQLLVQ